MPEEFDLLIQNVLIVDGTGTPGTKGDIGIKGERVAAVGNVSGSAKRVIDGAGLVACPGFIDMHSHADLNILQYPGADNCIMQGITTFVGGNCGMSPAPLKEFMPWGMERDWWHEVNPRSYGPPSFLSLEEYRSTAEEKLGISIDWTTFGDFLDRVETRGMSLNFVPLVGHNTIRLTVMGEDCRRTARPDEIAEMAKHVEEGMQAGAFGFSTGLDYLPGEYASPDEVLELTRVAKAHDGLYFTHTRFTNNVYPTDDPGRTPAWRSITGPQN